MNKLPLSLRVLPHAMWVVALIVFAIAFSQRADSQEKTPPAPPSAEAKAAAKETSLPAPPKEKKKKKQRGKAEDPFAVPETKDAGALVEFVERLDKFTAEVAELDEALATQTDVAIRRACEKILTLDLRKRAPELRFARRRLLQMDVEELADDDDASVPQKLLDDAELFMRNHNPDKADAKLAKRLCTLVEERDDEAKAKIEYGRFGNLFATNDDAEISRLGKHMIGAGRRMGIVGQSLAVKGTTVGGKSFDLASLKGKVVLVDFWTTWCSHCVDEMPNIKRHYTSYKDKGFEVVGVNCDADREKLDRFGKFHHVPWITLHNDQEGADQTAAIEYGIASYPTAFLVNREGKVVCTDVRGRTLRKELRKLLGPPAEDSAPRGAITAINNEEYVDRLMDASEALLDSGKAKDLTDLRKNVARKKWPMELAPAMDKVLTETEAYRQSLDSVFIIGGLHREDDDAEWEVAMGTAFVAGADGVMCTSYHVFQDDLKLTAMVAMDLRGRIFPVEELLASDPLADTCFFRVNAKGLRPLPLGSEAKPGEQTRIVSHPGNMFYYLSTGHVSNYFKDDDDVTWMNVSADFGQGASGAPVLDTCGNVIGQVSRTSTLYATGEEVSAKRRRSAGAAAPGRSGRPVLKTQIVAIESAGEPQMVFKSCTPVTSIRKLVAPK